MSRRTLALIVVLLIVTAFLLVIALTPQKPPVQPNVTTAQPTPVLAQTTLFFSPLLLNVATSSPSAAVDVQIDTGENKVTAVQLELSYDPKVLSNVDIASSGTSFFAIPITLLKKVDAENGKISYALGASPAGIGKKGTGTIARITFRAIAGGPQTTSITILPATLVTAEGIAASVLKESIGLKILIN